MTFLYNFLHNFLRVLGTKIISAASAFHYWLFSRSRQTRRFCIVFAAPDGDEYIKRFSCHGTRSECYFLACVLAKESVRGTDIKVIAVELLD
jgi:hypothetical protein